MRYCRLLIGITGRWGGAGALPSVLTAAARHRLHKSPALPTSPSLQVEAAQRAVLEAIEGVQGRGKGGMTPEQQAQFEEAVAILEADGGVQVGRCTLHPAGASAFIL